MRIAISTEGDSVSAHFGRCPMYTLVDIENGKETSRKKLDNPGHYPGRIPQFLYENGVDCIVCGGIGARATNLFEKMGLEVISGVDGSVQEVIEKIEEGSLEGGASFCQHGAGRGYGLPKGECTHGS